MMMRGITAENFDPNRYADVGLQSLLSNEGLLVSAMKTAIALRACTPSTWKRHPSRFIPSVSTEGPMVTSLALVERSSVFPWKSWRNGRPDLEKKEMIKQKCFLPFPTLPYIPKEPYDVIASDYDNFALVSGAKDRSFVQIYSRTPNLGPAFIETYKSYLARFRYDPSKIKETPQDCEVMSNSRLTAMMSMSGMTRALTNQFPELKMKAPVEFNPFKSVFDTLKKLLELYFK